MNGLKTAAVTTRFRAKGYAAEARIEGDGHSLAFAELPPVLRVLLLQDGTVTKTLEAFFWEPVAIRTIDQRMAELGVGTPLPGCEPDRLVLHRRVEIVGEVSQRLFCQATSLVRTDQLPDSVAEKLIAGRIGIGELLRDRGLETYRELESIYLSCVARAFAGSCLGGEPLFVPRRSAPSESSDHQTNSDYSTQTDHPTNPDRSDHSDHPGPPDHRGENARLTRSDIRVSRDYLIFLHHVPVVAITEHFPLHVFL